MIRQDERRSFFIALTLVAAARAQAAFEFTYGVDDYRQIIVGLSSLGTALLYQGRFGTYWLSEIFGVIGYDPGRAPFVTIVASVLLSTWIGNGVLRIWTDKVGDVTRALLIVIIAAHPYTSEILTFRGIAIYHILAGALAFAAILMARPSALGTLLPAVVFAAALTLYQVPVSFVSTFFVIDLALRLIRRCIDSENRSEYSMIDPNLYARWTTFAIGFGLYFICLKIATYGLPPHPFAVLLGFGELPSRLLRGLHIVMAHLVVGDAYDNPLVPRVIVLIPVLLLVIALVELIVRPVPMRRKIVAIIIIAAVPFVAGFAVLGMPLIAKILWLPPRVLPQIGLVWAGAAVMALVLIMKTPRWAVPGLLGLVVFVFIVQNNQIFIDQARVAVRDHDLVNRLVSRLETQSGYPMKSIVAVGARSDAGNPIPTSTHGFNDSNFKYWWAVAPMITERTGIPVRAVNPENSPEATEYCTGKAWPAADAAIIKDGVAIVCF